MYNTSLRIVGLSAEAEDIMQESFLKAFENLEHYHGEVSFGAWLKKIVVNRSLDSLKKKKLITQDINGLEDEMADADEMEVNGNISPEEILQEIKRLPDGYRIVLTLYLLEGYDHDEISEILKISPSTSRSQYARAKKKLTQNLKKKYNERY